MTSTQYKFPIQPPTSKEEFYCRTLLAKLFPSDTAALSVPSVHSVAFSLPIALQWDESFKNMNDLSGRAVKNVHDDSY